MMNRTQDRPPTMQDLADFSKEHYTWINQIFGDQSVREIIGEEYPVEDTTFVVDPATDEFPDSDHHVLVTPAGRWCSVEQGHQVSSRDIHDTLCQSYSLMKYFDIDIPKDRVQRQLDMVDMYRDILANKRIWRKINDEILANPENKFLWRDYTQPDEELKADTVKSYIAMNPKTIKKNIRRVLTDWKNYGYMYFIGDGRPQPNASPPRRSVRIANKNKVTGGGYTEALIELGLVPEFLPGLAPVDMSSAELKYAAQLFQDAIQMLGAVPANQPSTGYDRHFNLTPRQNRGRIVAKSLLDRLANYMPVAGTDRIIREAAIGLVVGAGVCDTYASLVAVLAVLKPGPVAGKRILVEGIGGHTKTYVYDIMIDVHDDIVFRQRGPRRPDTSVVEDLSRERPTVVYSKLREYMRLLSDEYNRGVNSLSQPSKDAYYAFINMKHDGSLASRLSVAEKLAVERELRQELIAELTEMGISPGPAYTKFIRRELPSRLKKRFDFSQ